MNIAVHRYRDEWAWSLAGENHYLTVDASLAARPFFESRGFSVTRENQLQRNGATLRNISMCKSPNQAS